MLPRWALPAGCRGARGGARGIAHIAILEALEEQGIPLICTGTSMGALVGGLYAAGYSPGELWTLMAETDLLTLCT